LTPKGKFLIIASEGWVSIDRSPGDRPAMGRAHGLRNAGKSLFAQRLRQRAVYIGGKPRPVINKARVRLHQRRSGHDLFEGVASVENAADADYRNATLCVSVKLCDHLSRTRRERPAAQAAVADRLNPG